MTHLPRNDELVQAANAGDLETVKRLDDDAAARMHDRSDSYSGLKDRLSEERLVADVLTPTREMTPDRFATHIEGYIIQLQAALNTTSLNMVGDALRTERPAANLKVLKDAHENDALVERAIQIGRIAWKLRLHRPVCVRSFTPTRRSLGPFEANDDVP